VFTSAKTLKKGERRRKRRRRKKRLGSLSQKKKKVLKKENPIRYQNSRGRGGKEGMGGIEWLNVRNARTVEREKKKQRWASFL